ncbi:vacuolar ATPase assembly integral membrane protein Vma21 isoform 1 [Mus musculus]|uniref:VMA21 vacuolar H+-ATPase homolog (S. cerevisiae) n=1 Tax=Mus musculus TaxID=10090 RepID=F2Z447_MOUSE|nr:vacuolar ATPase assembly integral membrane protein Vma21 isoform 1 [Mus musculus]|eukprot:NP_001277709.1 vacuolar ATPase assembly integral membrane protein Vma21 isoform 1 [Mus musculus]
MRCSLQSSGIPEFRWATVAARLWPGAGPRAGRRQGGLGDDPSTGHRRLMKRNENSLAATLKTLLFFTALMITVPIGLYFTTKAYIFEGALGMSNRDSYFYAAIVAVVAVHVVLALFVYVAWNEGSRQWREGKQD